MERINLKKKGGYKSPDFIPTLNTKTSSVSKEDQVLFK